METRGSRLGSRRSPRFCPAVETNANVGIVVEIQPRSTEGTSFCCRIHDVPAENTGFRELDENENPRLKGKDLSVFKL